MGEGGLESKKRCDKVRRRAEWEVSPAANLGKVPLAFFPEEKRENENQSRRSVEEFPENGIFRDEERDREAKKVLVRCCYVGWLVQSLLFPGRKRCVVRRAIARCMSPCNLRGNREEPFSPLLIFSSFFSGPHRVTDRQIELLPAVRRSFLYGRFC